MSIRVALPWVASVVAMVGVAAMGLINSQISDSLYAVLVIVGGGYSSGPAGFYRVGSRRVGGGGLTSRQYQRWKNGALLEVGCFAQWGSHLT